MSHSATTSAAPSSHSALSSHSASSAPAKSSSQAPEAATITIKNFAYQVSGTVSPGSTVQVTNDDTEVHTVSADSGHGFDVTVQPGKTVALTAPKAPGKYAFHCNFHAEMHGSLTVK